MKLKIAMIDVIKNLNKYTVDVENRDLILVKPVSVRTKTAIGVRKSRGNRKIFIVKRKIAEVGQVLTNVDCIIPEAKLNKIVHILAGEAKSGTIGQQI